MPHYLFDGRHSLHDHLAARNSNMIKEIEELGAGALLSASEGHLREKLVGEYSLEAPVLLTDDKFAYPPTEADVDIRAEPHRYHYSFRPNAPRYRKGTCIVFAVPFSGDPSLFRFRPSQMTYDVPEGRVVESEVQFTYEGAPVDPERVKMDLERDIRHVQTYLGFTTAQVAEYNSDLPRIAGNAISNRRQRLLQQSEMAARLGIPIRRRSDAPTTYAVPVRRRRAVVESLPAPSGLFEPEPALALEEYEHILSIVESMASVMERSPSTFWRLEEEPLRDHFLVQLNGQYEWDAAAEVFNNQGKTDILIRHEGRNVFIAECKFWDGAKCFLRTIDQLLSYTTWRDTKTAILLFSKKRDFTRVVKQISPVVQQHPCFRREADVLGPSKFRFALHRQGDTEREVILTVCAFHIPRPPETS